MKFSVPRSEFFKAIQRVIGAIQVKTTIPLLGDLLLQLENNTLQIFATDLEIMLSTKIRVEGVEDGTLAVPAKMLNEILRELGDVKIEVLSEENFRLKLISDRGVYKIAGDSGDEFPLMPVSELVNEFTIPPSQIARMVEKTIFAVSRDELRAALTGVLFQIAPEDLTLVATDAHRLVRIKATHFSADVEEKNIIVPTKALSLLLKNVAEEKEPIRIAFGENYIVFRLEQTEIISRLIDSNYPKYEEAIPQKSEKKLILNRDLFASSLRRISIFSNLSTRQVHLSLKPEKIEVYSHDFNVGAEGMEVLPAEYEGEEMEIGYNSVYIQEMIRHVDTEEVVMELGGPLSPTLIFPMQQMEGEDLLMLLMPINLESAEEEESEEADEYEDYGEASYSEDMDY